MQRPVFVRHRALCVLLLSIPLLSGCLTDQTTPERTLVDDSGISVDVGDLSRIVVTSVDLAEVFVLLGHGERLVGVPGWIASSSGCVSIVPGGEALPRIGRPVVIDAEEVVAKDPSLVVDKPFPLAPSDLAPRLRAIGIPTYSIDATESLDNIRHTLTTVGRILEPVDPDALAKAEALWHDIKDGIEEVEDALANATVTRPDTLYQLPAGLVAAGGTSGSLLLRLAGARDLAEGAGLEGYRQLSSEVVAAGDPERLVVSCTAGTPSILGSPRFSGTTAARWGPVSVFVADPATSALVGPRFHHGVREVAEWLHPAAFGLITPTVHLAKEERTLSVDAANSTATDPPLRHLLDPGDGSPPVESGSGSFSYQYDDRKSYQPVLLLVDSKGRLHVERLVTP
ncbi:MAG: ABC transporter substrate-binding protein [Euryarchaeota archaeon]|nr:ABC transporter substrate-binding protein [Euryarchaeota archaeon]